MAKNGVKAEKYREWIDNSITIDDMLNVILSEFVLGTPAYNLSRKGRDFYSHYKLDTLMKYQILKDELVDNLDFKSFEKYEQLKAALISNPRVLFNAIPTNLEEAIYMYTGTITDNKFYKDHFKRMVPNEAEGRKKTRKEISSYSALKRSVVEIDRLFAHLRNGIAHGCFTKYMNQSEYIYIIQDETPDNYISARFIISEKRIANWIRLLNNLEEKSFL